MIFESAAWRKILFRRVIGATPLLIMLRSTSPAPTDGSWSISPTNKTCVPGRTAFSRWFISSRSSIEASSTTKKSRSSGFSSLCLNPSTGENSNKRWMVLAGCPVASERRFAARPVGEARAKRLRCSEIVAIKAFKQVVFPVPGPPVRMLSGCVSAIFTAACCSADRFSTGNRLWFSVCSCEAALANVCNRSATPFSPK